MILWEVTTGFIGESYERCYIWAEDEMACRRLAQFQIDKEPQKGRRIAAIRILFGGEEEAFCTKLSDEGFYRE